VLPFSPPLALPFLPLLSLWPVVWLSRWWRLPRAQAPAPTLCPPHWNRPEASRPEQGPSCSGNWSIRGHLLEAQSAVLKIVAKLVGPAVVHIETRRPARVQLGLQPCRHVKKPLRRIIELKGTIYVLTNRHVVRGAAPAAIRINLAAADASTRRRFRRNPATDVAVLRFRHPFDRRALGATAIGCRLRLSCWRGQPLRAEPFRHVWNTSAPKATQAHLGDANTIVFQDFLVKPTPPSIPANSGGPLSISAAK